MIKERKFFIACEKPLVAVLEDGEKIMKTIDEYDWDDHTAVSFNKRRFQAVSYARELVKSGRLGDILMFHGRYNGGRVPTFQIPGLDPKLCSGYANCMCHLADICTYILDDHFDEVVGEVHAAPNILLAHEPKPGENIDDIPLEESIAEDCGLMIAKMKSGLTVTLVRESNYLGCLEDITYEVLRTKASIRWNGMNPNRVEFCDGSDPKGERGFKKIYMGAMHPYGNCVAPHQRWAIGVNGKPASVEYAEEKHQVIKKCLVELFGEEVGLMIPVLYGGSVNQGNANQLISQPSIDGLFIGRSAWRADAFDKLIRNAVTSTSVYGKH